MVNQSGLPCLHRMPMDTSLEQSIADTGVKNSEFWWDEK